MQPWLTWNSLCSPAQHVLKEVSVMQTLNYIIATIENFKIYKKAGKHYTRRKTQVHRKTLCVCVCVCVCVCMLA
jgi:hypothetical protein